MASSVQSFGKGALRIAKNYTKGYSDTQTKVREATSNDPWGPSGTQMNEIAQLTYNQSDFVEIMEMLDKRLNDKGKNWRHVFKALTVLDYCLHAGSENVVIYFKDNLYIIKTLKEFVYIDDVDKDVGANVRQKAKDITNLLQDEERLRQERRSRGAMQDRMAGVTRRSEDDDENLRRRNEPARQQRPKQDEDADLQKAIAASLSADDEAERKRIAKEEAELARILAISEGEDNERKRREEEDRKKLDQSNTNALFDDSFQLNGPDLFAQQLPQQQPQPTGGWPLVDTSYGQSQFNPFYQQQMLEQQQQQQQQQQAQQQYLQMQYQAQQEQLAREQAAAQQAYLYQQQQLQAQQQQQQLMPQPTGYGSNNPFALGFQPQQQQPQFTGFQQPQGLSPQPQPSPEPFFSAPTPVQQPAKPRPAKNDGEHERLAALLANGREGGLDTFGNVGNLRLAAHHTAPQRLTGQMTGANNPFGQRQDQQQQHFNQSASGNLVDF